MMLPCIQYSWYVLRHKWYVALECWKRGLYWQGFVHDWTKFRPSEFFPYAAHFFGKERKADIKGPGIREYGLSRPFDTAWQHHANRNPHHWQYWVQPYVEDDGTVEIKAVEIPHRYRMEMFCDWIGAGKAQGTGGVKEWYGKNQHRIIVGPVTRSWLDVMVKYHDA